MTGFFNPQGFLTAMKQEVNRKHAKDKWALDDVVMTSQVTHPPKDVEQLKDGMSEGVYVYGLFLEGCRWDGKQNKLVDSDPKKLFTPLPVLEVTGVLGKDKVTKGVYEAPTYRVKKRTGLNFISTFPAANGGSPEQVGHARRGVALLGGLRKWIVDFGSRAPRTLLAARPTTTTTNLVYERPEPFSGDFPNREGRGVAAESNSE